METVPLPDQLIPSPSRLAKKPGKPCFEDFQPSTPSFQPTDISICKCTCFLQGQGAVVTAAENIWALIRLGSYGIGTFSRGIPSHHHIPSLNELQHMSRKRKSMGSGISTVLDKWMKRIRLHQQWVDEQKSGSQTELERDVTDTFDISESVDFEDSKSQDVSDRESVDEDGDQGVDEEYEYKSFLTRLRTVQKKDPYVLDEYLQLGAEETFYLVSEVKVLSVVTMEGVELCVKDLWLHFSKQNYSFPIRYAAYRHFRIGNWVPKSGLKYGVDFLLYKDGPVFYHSSYAVLVREQGQRQNRLKWKDVISLNRVSEAAGKDLLVCDVTIPSDLEVEEGVLRGVDQMTITDTVVKRWVPERDRDMSQ